MAKKNASAADLDQVRILSERADALLTNAKVGTEKAKTRNIHSDSDVKDLNYLEQESGVQQTRDLQKIHGQAEAQTRMKVVESLLKPEKTTAN